VTTRLFVQVDADTYLSIAATAPPGAFDTWTFSTLLGTIGVSAPGATT
jgi:hypothetical protein